MRYLARPEILIKERLWFCFFPRLKEQIFFLIQNCDKDIVLPGCIVLTNDKEMRRLNYRFRGKNMATNVLTFPSPFPSQNDGGAVVIAFQTLKREAQAMRRSLWSHFAHLLVHGFLHLTGYDHHHPGDARRMEMREASLSHRLHFPNPWK